jgi:exodeoxyribonuclease VII large subunit
MEKDFEQKILSVADFNIVLNEIFTTLPEFRIHGEITSLNISRNNAVFIDLKDTKQEACVRLSNFAPWVEGLRAVKEGMEVIISGHPEIYSRTGSFSIKVRKIEPMGEGSLKKAFEELKLNLQQAGYFAIDRKRVIPQPLTHIALLTGKDSAAYADFTKILHEYHSALEIDYYPVLVQGNGSEEEIARAMSIANRSDAQVIVLARGGGSLEDLKSFNSELLAESIYNSRLPVITGVGHEVDESIADYVADVRASTPSQAAYFLIQHTQEFIENASLVLEKIEKDLNSIIPETAFINSYVQTMTHDLLSFIPKEERLDYRIEKMAYNLTNLMPSKMELQSKLRMLNSGCNKIISALGRFSLSTSNFYNDSPLKCVRLIKACDESLLMVGKLLDSYNPKFTLNRGYTLIRREGKYISSRLILTQNEEIDIIFKDGETKVTII